MVYREVHTHHGTRVVLPSRPWYPGSVFIPPMVPGVYNPPMVPGVYNPPWYPGSYSRSGTRVVIPAQVPGWYMPAVLHGWYMPAVLHGWCTSVGVYLRVVYLSRCVPQGGYDAHSGPPSLGELGSPEAHRASLSPPVSLLVSAHFCSFLLVLSPFCPF